MNAPAKFLARTFLFASICALGASCSDTDPFFNDQQGTETEKETNTFDFSTARKVDLIVDYSDFEANIPVFFSVYNTNPIVNENTIGEYIDESIQPLFSGYTGKDGRFDATITLPAYAKRLHIVTGNFLVGLRRNVTLVHNGKVTLIVEDPLRDTKKNIARRVTGTGVSTNDLSKMHNLSFCIDSNGKATGDRIYKDWLTALGTWNSASGRPDYLLDKATANPALLFSEEELLGLYTTACDALNSGTAMKEQYRAASDLTIVEDGSEVSITALGSSTCWNSSLGYYFYSGSAPTQRTDLNIIMIFPNTQDGQWPRGSYPNNKYKGNIGMQRGDAVQLMYYPTKADGSLDLTKGTTKFPKGTKIGFILKANSWGCLGSDYSVNSCTNKINIWGASTDGLSKSPLSGVNYPNKNSESRAAKFAYTAPNGNSYVALTFEDACDDKDYDDLVFALNPANAFDFGDMAKVESRVEETHSVYAFEDMWPDAGDYDMNDIVVDCAHEKEFYKHGNDEKNNGLAREMFKLTTFRNSAVKQSGLGIRVTNDASIATIYASKIAKGEKTPITENLSMKNKKYYWLPEYTFLTENIDKKENIFFYLTDDISKELGTTYTIDVTYANAQKASMTNIELFIYRKEGSKYWEVHLPLQSPTSRVQSKYFGTLADRSNYSKKTNFYTRSGDYPFAFCLEGVSIEQFKGTILKPENETKPIDTFFPGFIEWSRSNGTTNEDWYLHPVADTEPVSE